MYRQLQKSLLNSNISSICPHNMVNFGQLTAETGWRVWGTPGNINRFRVLALLLQQRCSMEVNQTLHDVWSSPGLVHYIHFWGLLPPTEVCQVQNSLCVQVFHSPTLAALLHAFNIECATYIQPGGHHVGHWPHSCSVSMSNEFK